MSISVADNFSYQGTKPLDARFQFSSVANMKAAAEATLYNGCFAYVTGTKKYYSYDSSNTVDPTTGKWREYESGGEDAKAYHTDDTAEAALADADYFPFYDTSATAKRKTLWSNIKSNLKTYFDTLYNKYTLPTATSSVLGGVKIGENMTIEDGVINPSYLVVANKFNKADLYSTTEKVVGCWTDGRPIYQKTLVDTMPSCATDGTYVDKYISIGASILNFISINCIARDRVGSEFELSFLSKTQQLLSNNQIISARAQCLDNNASNNANTLRISSSGTAFNTYSLYATLQYTKTTDAANSFKYADENDYSTSEKIIGSWVDGKILYQKTFQTTMPECTVNETTGAVTVGISYVSVGANVDYFVSGQLALKSSSNACVLSIPYVPSTQAYQVTALNTWQNGITIPCTRITGFTNTVSSNKNTIRLENAMSGHNGATVYITVKYTKV